MKTLSAPLNICLGITNQCNLNCRHCLASNTRNSRDLTTAGLLNIIGQMRELKVLSAAIFGGEPLMRKDFFTILEELSRSKINISLNTNGTLISGEIAGRLSQYPVKSYVVSLDGSCPEVHDPFRGKESFKKTIEGIQNLIDRKSNVLISTIVTRFNHKDIENIALLGKKLGAGKVRFNDVAYIGNAACYHESLVMTPVEKFELLDRVRGLKSRFNDFVTGSVIQSCDIMDEIKCKPKESFPLRIHSCGAATTKCAIRPDGHVVPCEILWDESAGDLAKQSLRDIWRDSPVMKAFRETMVIEEDEVPECKGCDYLRACYKGHRCQPYYYPGVKFEHKELYCWREDVAGAK